MKTLAIGSVLPTAELLLKYNSQNDFSIFFWDDAAGTVASNLSISAVTLEIEVAGVAITGSPFTGTVVGTTNEVQFSITAAQSLLTVQPILYRVVLTKNSKRYIVLTGEVRLQK